MKKNEPMIGRNPNENFSHLIAFCEGNRVCSLDRVPFQQIEKMTELLNERGEGWLGTSAITLWSSGGPYRLAMTPCVKIAEQRDGMKRVNGPSIYFLKHLHLSAYRR